MTETISGQDLINAGLPQGKWFAKALAAANVALAGGSTLAQALEIARGFLPPPVLTLKHTGETPLHVNIEAESPAEADNVAKVLDTMRILLRTPVIRSGAVMPDACPAGPPGTIPVGGIAVSDAIHPGMHSADICCSMAISVFPGVTPPRATRCRSCRYAFRSRWTSARRPVPPRYCCHGRF